MGQTALGSSQLWKLAEQVTPGGINTSLRKLRQPVVFTRAKGARMWDAEGNEYIEYHNGFGPVILGHCHERVNARVFAALQEIDVVGAGTTLLEIELAQKLTEYVPSCEMVHLCNIGSEATFHAVRLSRAYTGRTEFIKIQGAYNGWHDYLAMNFGGSTRGPELYQPTPLSAGALEDAYKHTHVVPFNDLDAVHAVWNETKGQVAGIILEPIMHNVGCIMPQPDYLANLRQYCTERGIVLVFDEVITGFRHALGGYQSICGVTPDLTTLAKAMANGYPIAAICGKRALMEQFNTTSKGKVMFAGTYNGHTLSCAAALATIEELEGGEIHRHLYALGDRLRNGLNEIIQRLHLKAFAAGHGSIWNVYFMDPEKPVRSYVDLLDHNVGQEQMFRALLMGDGIFTIPYPMKRNYICAAITDADIDRTLNVAEAALIKIAREGSSQKMKAGELI
jgi:glutamate-1-semialdehyde 2,1-aminomutase